MIKLKDLLAIMYPRTFIVLEAFRHNGLPEGYAEDLLETLDEEFLNLEVLEIETKHVGDTLHLDIDTEPIKQAIKENRDFNIYKERRM